MAHHRPRARGHRGSRLRRLLPRGVGHRRVLQPGEHLLPGPWQRSEQRRLLRPRHHQGRRRRPRAAVRAVPLTRARRPARHRPRHRERPARRSHPVRVRALRPSPHRAGGERHHLPGPVVGARHGPRPRLRSRSAGRVEQADGRVGHGADHGRPGRPRHPRAGDRARARDRGRAAPSRYPLGWHGHLRPAGHRGVPGRVGAHGQAERAAVGQGRLRCGGPGEVRPARPRHAQRAALRGRSHP